MEVILEGKKKIIREKKKKKRKKKKRGEGADPSLINPTGSSARALLVVKSMRFSIFILKPNAFLLDPPYGKEIKQN